MKLLHNFFILSFLTYLLFISSGLTVSHIYCSNGERWIFGSEMPEHKIKIEKKNCSNHNKEGDSRSKDTYSFEFKIDRKNFSNQNIVLETNFLFSENIIIHSGFKPFINTNTYKGLQTYPNPRFKPNLTILQVFRI